MNQVTQNVANRVAIRAIAIQDLENDYIAISAAESILRERGMRAADMVRRALSDWQTQIMEMRDVQTNEMAMLHRMIINDAKYRAGEEEGTTVPSGETGN